MWERTVITLCTQLLKDVVKNPKKKAALKKVLLALRDSIDAAYSGE